MDSPPPFWDGVLRRLGTDVPAHGLDAWLRPLVVEPRGEGLALVCPTPFHRERVRQRFLPQIARCIEQELGRALSLELDVRQAVAGSADAGAAPSVAPPVAPATGHVPAAARPERAAPRAWAPASPRVRAFQQTFETFVVGPGNALAREASLACAERRQTGIDPLYLASEPGLGKTHLARAVCQEARRHGAERIIYEPSEAFTNRFLAAIRTRQTEAFKDRYRRGCELLVLEDVQFLSAKAATQLELFHTLGHLADAGTRVVLTGDRLPRDITGIDERLRSLLTAGLVAEIERPDAAVRRRILRARASAGGVRVPEECLDLLVEAVRGSVRDLEGALIQLVATASLLGRAIDLELTRAALHKLSPIPAPAVSLDPASVIECVARFFGLTREAISARSRRRDVLLPRQLAMYLCRRYTDAPLAAIARCFDRDHPAVANAVKAIERRMLERAPLRYQVEELSSRLDRLREARASR